MAVSLREVQSRAELDELVGTTTTGRLLVVYSATWCGYCRMLKHELDALVEAGEANVLIIDVDGKREQLADKGITGLPHIEFFQDGVFIGKQSGFSRRDELLSKFK